MADTTKVLKELINAREVGNLCKALDYLITKKTDPDPKFAENQRKLSKFTGTLTLKFAIDNDTLLTFACENSSKQIVEVLWSKLGSNNAKRESLTTHDNTKGENIFAISLRRGALDICDYLVECEKTIDRNSLSGGKLVISDANKRWQLMSAALDSEDSYRWLHKTMEEKFFSTTSEPKTGKNIVFLEEADSCLRFLLKETKCKEMVDQRGECEVEDPSTDLNAMTVTITKKISALTAACYEKKTAKVKTLLDLGAHPDGGPDYKDVRMSDVKTPLIVAITTNQGDLVKTLLDHQRSDLEFQSKFGDIQTLLTSHNNLMVFETGTSTNAAVVAGLQQSGAAVASRPNLLDVFVNKKREKFKHAFQNSLHATKWTSGQEIWNEFSKGVKDNKIAMGGYLQTLLIKPVHTVTHFKDFLRIYAKHEDINAPHTWSQTLLFYAAKHQRVEIVRFMVEELGARIDIYDQSKGFTTSKNCIHYAASNIYYAYEMMPYLLDLAVKHLDSTGVNLLYDASGKYSYFLLALTEADCHLEYFNKHGGDLKASRHPDFYSLMHFFDNPWNTNTSISSNASSKSSSTDPVMSNLAGQTDSGSKKTTTSKKRSRAGSVESNASNQTPTTRGGPTNHRFEKLLKPMIVRDLQYAYASMQSDDRDLLSPNKRKSGQNSVGQHSGRRGAMTDDSPSSQASPASDAMYGTPKSTTTTSYSDPRGPNFPTLLKKLLQTHNLPVGLSTSDGGSFTTSKMASIPEIPDIPAGSNVADWQADNTPSAISYTIPTSRWVFSDAHLRLLLTMLVCADVSPLSMVLPALTKLDHPDSTLTARPHYWNVAARYLDDSRFLHLRQVVGKFFPKSFYTVESLGLIQFISTSILSSFGITAGNLKIIFPPEDLPNVTSDGAAIGLPTSILIWSQRYKVKKPKDPVSLVPGSALSLAQSPGPKLPATAAEASASFFQPLQIRRREYHQDNQDKLDTPGGSGGAVGKGKKPVTPLGIATPTSGAGSKALLNGKVGTKVPLGGTKAAVGGTGSKAGVGLASQQVVFSGHPEAARLPISYVCRWMHLYWIHDYFPSLDVQHVFPFLKNDKSDAVTSSLTNPKMTPLQLTVYWGLHGGADQYFDSVLLGQHYYDFVKKPARLSEIYDYMHEKMAYRLPSKEIPSKDNYGKSLPSTVCFQNANSCLTVKYDRGGHQAIAESHNPAVSDGGDKIPDIEVLTPRISQSDFCDRSSIFYGHFMAVHRPAMSLDKTSHDKTSNLGDQAHLVNGPTQLNGAEQSTQSNQGRLQMSSLIKYDLRAFSCLMNECYYPYRAHLPKLDALLECGADMEHTCDGVDQTEVTAMWTAFRGVWGYHKWHTSHGLAQTPPVIALESFCRLIKHGANRKKSFKYVPPNATWLQHGNFSGNAGIFHVGGASQSTHGGQIQIARIPKPDGMREYSLQAAATAYKRDTMLNVLTEVLNEGDGSMLHSAKNVIATMKEIISEYIADPAKRAGTSRTGIPRTVGSKDDLEDQEALKSVQLDLLTSLKGLRTGDSGLVMLPDSACQTAGRLQSASNLSTIFNDDVLRLSPLNLASVVDHDNEDMNLVHMAVTLHRKEDPLEAHRKAMDATYIAWRQPMQRMEKRLVDLIRWLVFEQNVDPFSRDKRGRTPFFMACERGYMQVMELYRDELFSVSPPTRDLYQIIMSSQTNKSSGSSGIQVGTSKASSSRAERNAPTHTLPFTESESTADRLYALLNRNGYFLNRKRVWTKGHATKGVTKTLTKYHQLLEVVLSRIHATQSDDERLAEVIDSCNFFNLGKNLKNSADTEDYLTLSEVLVALENLPQESTPPDGKNEPPPTPSGRNRIGSEESRASKKRKTNGGVDEMSVEGSPPGTNTPRNSAATNDTPYVSRVKEFLDDPRNGIFRSYLNRKLTNQTDVDGKTPMFEAAKSGRVQVVQWLLKHEARVNIIDTYENSILHEAIQYGTLQTKYTTTENKLAEIKERKQILELILSKMPELVFKAQVINSFLEYDSTFIKQTLVDRDNAFANHLSRSSSTNTLATSFLYRSLITPIPLCMNSKKFPEVSKEGILDIFVDVGLVKVNTATASSVNGTLGGNANSSNAREAQMLSTGIRQASEIHKGERYLSEEDAKAVVEMKGQHVSPFFAAVERVSLEELEYLLGVGVGVIRKRQKRIVVAFLVDCFKCMLDNHVRFILKTTKDSLPKHGTLAILPSILTGSNDGNGVKNGDSLFLETQCGEALLRILALAPLRHGVRVPASSFFEGLFGPGVRFKCIVDKLVELEIETAISASPGSLSGLTPEGSTVGGLQGRNANENMDEGIIREADIPDVVDGGHMDVDYQDLFGNMLKFQENEIKRMIQLQEERDPGEEKTKARQDIRENLEEDPNEHSAGNGANFSLLLKKYGQVLCDFFEIPSTLPQIGASDPDDDQLSMLNRISTSLVSLERAEQILDRKIFGASGQESHYKQNSDPLLSDDSILRHKSDLQIERFLLGHIELTGNSSSLQTCIFALPNNPSIAKFLILRNPYLLRLADKEMRTIFHHLCANGCHKVLEFLLETRPADTTGASRAGTTTTTDAASTSRDNAGDIEGAFRECARFRDDGFSMLLLPGLTNEEHELEEFTLCSMERVMEDRTDAMEDGVTSSIAGHIPRMFLKFVQCVATDILADESVNDALLTKLCNEEEGFPDYENVKRILGSDMNGIQNANDSMNGVHDASDHASTTAISMKNIFATKCAALQQQTYRITSGVFSNEDVAAEREKLHPFWWNHTFKIRSSKPGKWEEPDSLFQRQHHQPLHLLLSALRLAKRSEYDKAMTKAMSNSQQNGRNAVSNHLTNGKSNGAQFLNLSGSTLAVTGGNIAGTSAGGLKPKRVLMQQFSGAIDTFFRIPPVKGSERLSLAGDPLFEVNFSPVVDELGDPITDEQGTQVDGQSNATTMTRTVVKQMLDHTNGDSHAATTNQKHGDETCLFDLLRYIKAQNLVTTGSNKHVAEDKREDVRLAMRQLDILRKHDLNFMHTNAEGKTASQAVQLDTKKSKNSKDPILQLISKYEADSLQILQKKMAQQGSAMQGSRLQAAGHLPLGSPQLNGTRGVAPGAGVAGGGGNLAKREIHPVNIFKDVVATAEWEAKLVQATDPDTGLPITDPRAPGFKKYVIRFEDPRDHSNILDPNDENPRKRAEYEKMLSHLTDVCPWLQLHWPADAPVTTDRGIPGAPANGQTQAESIAENDALIGPSVMGYQSLVRLPQEVGQHDDQQPQTGQGHFSQQDETGAQGDDDVIMLD